MPEPTPEFVITDALKHTMQALPDAKKDGALGGSFWAEYSRNPILSPWGTRKREKELRALYRHDDSTMVRGALAGIATEIACKQWTITGPEKLSKDAAKYYRQAAKAADINIASDVARPDILYYQELLRNADFGRGYSSFAQKLWIDYLRQDGGAFVEVIAPGKATGAPTGAIAGLAVLDSLRCWPTGDPEYPVVYWNRKAEYHLIHCSRVLQFQDMPDSDEMTPGYGMCALSRAVAVAYREILMTRYVATQLDDLPPPGIINASGMNEASREKSLALYRRDQNGADMKPDWGRLMWVFGADPTIPIKLDMVQFSTPPEKFDWKIYTDLDVDLLALAIGVDRQDLMQLSGGSGLSGSKGQSETLSQKARGKLKGLMYAEFTRKMNDIFPDEYEFKFTDRDSQQENDIANNAQVWAGVTTSLSGVLSPDEQRNLLADKVESIKDVISDEDGKILSVGDGDVQTAQQIADDAAAVHALAIASTPKPVAEGGSVDSGGTNKPVPKRPGMVAKLGRDNDDRGEKALQATRLDFENDFAEAVQAVKDGVMTRRRFGVVARALISKYGKSAFIDGLAEGGISDTELSSDDYVTISSMTVEQSAYVTAFANALFAGVDYTPEARAEMWWNKSINPFYQAGVASADKNGLYEWVIGQTEHCSDCLAMDGQIHRYRDYVKRGILPNSSYLECGGWNCQCTLAKRRGKARGKWLSLI